MIYETQEQLDEALAFWQKVLRLQDWDISATLVRRKDLGGRGDAAEGVVNVHLRLKHAIIRLISHIDSEGEADERPNEWQLDHEKVLVHELLHIHLEPFFPEEDGLQYDMAEQATEAIARSIVRLRRGSS